MLYLQVISQDRGKGAVMRRTGLSDYFDRVFREHDCYATWPPGTLIAVGAIGRLSENGSFIETGSLATRPHGRKLPAPRKRPCPDETLATSGGVAFSADVNVETDEVTSVLTDASAKVDITLSRSGAAAMVLKQVNEQLYLDERPIKALMREMLEAGLIDDDEIVVTWVREALSGAIVAMYDRDMEGGGEVKGSFAPATVSLVNAGGHLSIVSQSHAQTVAEASPGRPLTPMYRALVFKRNRHWWTFWRSQIEIGSAIRTRPAQATGDSELIAASRPSLAEAGPSDPVCDAVRDQSWRGPGTHDRA